MQTVHRFLKVFGLMCAATAFVALYLLTWHLTAGGIPATETPLIWFWDNIAVYAGSNLWWDPLLAAFWMLVPAMAIVNRFKYDDLEWAAVFGLAASGGIHLVFWGEPGVMFWPLMVPMAFITGRITNLIEERAAAADGFRLKNRYNFLDATEFTCCFGLGLLLPLALTRGFLLATCIWWIYALGTLFICSATYGVLYAPRPFVWLFRKIRSRFAAQAKRKTEAKQ